MRYYSTPDSNVLRRANMGPEVLAAKQLEDWRLGSFNARRIRGRLGNYNARRIRGLGAINQGLVSAGGAAGGAIAGATAGSVVPVVGTAIGMVVGAVIGILTQTNNTASHIGTWDASLAQGIQSLPASASGIGRQIPWNENSHGLVQMIEALLATGNYMAWDASLKSSYAVCAHWAVTFGAAVQALVTTIVSTQPGPATVSISESPGANHAPINFVFTNPGINAGPDYIAANCIMGANGLMYAMIVGLGETATHATSNANNGLAQKVFALMVDNIAASLVPAVPAVPVPAIAPAVAAASVAANAAVTSGVNPQAAAVQASLASPYPTAGATALAPAAPAPLVSYPTGGAAIGYSAPAGYPTSTAALPVSTASIVGGIPDWLLIGVAVVGLGFLFFKQAPVASSSKLLQGI